MVVADADALGAAFGVDVDSVETIAVLLVETTTFIHYNVSSDNALTLSIFTPFKFNYCLSAR